jgi:hypothetical protein
MCMQTSPTKPDPSTFDPFSIRLEHGGHGSPSDGLCLLEAAAYVAGEPHSDHPQCVCPVLGAYGRALNDTLGDDDRQRLRPLIVKLLNTRSTPDIEIRRAFTLVDSVTRVQWPLVFEAFAIACDAAGFEGDGAELGNRFRAHAATFRALPSLDVKPDPNAPPPTFSVKKEGELDELAIFTRCGYYDDGEERARLIAADLNAGRYRDLNWFGARVAGDEEWVVELVPGEGTSAARAARADLADLAARAARAARAPTVSEQVNAKRKEIIDETIAVFERAIAISNSPAEEVGGSAATDEVGRAPLTSADQDDAGDGADPVALGRALADLHAERASIDDEPAEGESSGADVGGEG